MNCHFCGRHVDIDDYHTHDSEGGVRCLSHPEERDALSAAEVTVRDYDSQIRALQARIAHLQGFRDAAYRDFCASLEAYRSRREAVDAR